MSDRSPTITRVFARCDADLHSPSGSIFTYVESDGQLQVNLTALSSQAAADGRRGETPPAVRLGSLIFQPAATAGGRS